MSLGPSGCAGFVDLQVAEAEVGERLEGLRARPHDVRGRRGWSPASRAASTPGRRDRAGSRPAWSRCCPATPGRRSPAAAPRRPPRSPPRPRRRPACAARTGWHRRLADGGALRVGRGERRACRPARSRWPATRRGRRSRASTSPAGGPARPPTRRSRRRRELRCGEGSHSAGSSRQRSVRPVTTRDAVARTRGTAGRAGRARRPAGPGPARTSGAARRGRCVAPPRAPPVRSTARTYCSSG